MLWQAGERYFWRKEHFGTKQVMTLVWTKLSQCMSPSPLGGWLLEEGVAELGDLESHLTENRRLSTFTSVHAYEQCGWSKNTFLYILPEDYDISQTSKSSEIHIHSLLHCLCFIPVCGTKTGMQESVREVNRVRLLGTMCSRACKQA
jgi:hypothetical protein